MIKKRAVFLLLGLVSVFGHAAEKHERPFVGLDVDSSDSFTISCADSNDLVEDELTALESGEPTEIDLNTNLLIEALRNNVYRTPQEREKFEKMVKESPIGYQLLAQLFNDKLPKRNKLEVYAKTLVHVRPSASIRLDEGTQAAVKQALKEYRLEKSYEQLKAYLETAHIANDKLRKELVHEQERARTYKKKWSKLKREREKRVEAKLKKD